jgi:3-oxoacyl-[acyl-carrier protein] reductase
MEALQTSQDHLRDRVAIITGASRGIGRAIALALAAEGAKVVVNYVSSSSAAEDVVAAITETGGEATALQADVSKLEQVEALFNQTLEKFGRVDVLVNNAGITRDTLLLRMCEDDWGQVLETNLTGSFRVVKRAAKGMLRMKRGRIIVMSSVVAMLGSPGQVNYAASKAGLIGMARSLARELGSRNVTANVVAPGFVETDMTGELSEDTKATYQRQIPLGRFCTPEEVAGVVRWLASEEAAYITGAVIPVDGGLGMGH